MFGKMNLKNACRLKGARIVGGDTLKVTAVLNKIIASD